MGSDARRFGARAQTQTEFVPTFSTNARVRQQLDRLQRMAGQKLWDQWLAGYQQLVDDPRDLVLARDQEFLIGVRHYCHQLLAALPPAVRQRYRTLYDPEARRLYDKAAAEKDGKGMREVYSRCRFSGYGGKALHWIADQALDQGHAEIARVAYSRLATEPGVSATTLLRYALAAAAAGRNAEAGEVLDRVRKKYGAQQVSVGGQPVQGSSASDLLGEATKGGPRGAEHPASNLSDSSDSSGSWSSFAGDAGDRRMPGGPAGPLKRLWEFVQPTSTGGVTSYRVNQLVIIGGSSDGRFSFLTFPIVSGDRVWVQGPRNLTALKRQTGQPEWDHQEFVLGRDEMSNENSNPRMGGIYYPSGRPAQAAPAVEGHLLVTRAPMASGDRDGNRWPVDYAIVVFDARTGKQLWRRLAGGEPRGLYFNLPAIQANTVLTGIATFKGGITEYTAQALDAGTGEPLWSTYLGAGSDPLGVVDGSPAAVKDGLVWIESSLYTLSALDLITGDVRLIYHYDPPRRMTYRSGLDNSPPISNEPISLVATGAGPVVFAPRWGSDVIALDPATGKLLWSSPKAPGQSITGSLFAVDDKRAYICGDHLQAINLVDGSREWTWEAGAPASVGYAALVGDRIYVPVDGKILVRAATDKQDLGTLDVGDQLGESPGLCSLVSAGGMLLVSTREKVVAFGPK